MNVTIIDTMFVCQGTNDGRSLAASTILEKMGGLSRHQFRYDHKKGVNACVVTFDELQQREMILSYAVIEGATSNFSIHL